MEGRIDTPAKMRAKGFSVVWMAVKASCEDTRQLEQLCGMNSGNGTCADNPNAHGLLFRGQMGMAGLIDFTGDLTCILSRAVLG
jgi:hypothetical protein